MKGSVIDGVINNLGLVVVTILFLMAAFFATPARAQMIVTVNPNNMNGWGFLNETPVGSGAFVYGPPVSPNGIGSAQLTVDDNGGEDLVTLAFAGTLLNTITSLSYDTYRSSGTSSLAPALDFDVDTDAADTAWEGRLVYEPYYTHTVSTGVWQTWNPLDNSSPGNWWFTGAPGDVACPITAPCTWSEVLADFPNAAIRPPVDSGETLFKAGGGWTGGFEGNVDSFSIGVNGVVTTYNFEPAVPNPNAIKFIFANTTSSAVVGGNVTLKIEAINASGTVDTSFEQDVTLTVSGSGSGSGLVTIINGVGTATVSDNVAETVSLGLEDTQSTGLDVSSTANITFIPSPVAPLVVPPTLTSAGSPSTQVAPGIKPTITITFSGMAYPNSSVMVISKAQGLRATPVTEAVPVAADGSFLVQLNNVIRLTGQTYLLSFVDRNGFIAQTKAYNIPVQDKLVYGNILAAPTLGFENSSIITGGKPLEITGYATPGATVELFIDGNPAGTVLVNNPLGEYTYQLDTDTLSFGRHSVWALQKNAQGAVEVSGYTNPLSQDELFVDDSTNNVLLAQNASGTYTTFVPATGETGTTRSVTVGPIYTKQAESDFSNQESFTVSPLQNPKLDLDGTGVIDIGDLSIFLSYLKNLNADLMNFHVADPNIVKVLDFTGSGVVDVQDLDILEAAIAAQANTTTP